MTDFSQLLAETQEFVSRGDFYVEEYEDARRLLAALRGEEYTPRIQVIQPLPEPAPPRKRTRSQYVRLTAEALRDWAVKKGRTQGHFTRPEMIEELGISATSAVNKSNELVEKGWFAPQRNGGTLVFSYVDPKQQPGGGPKVPAREKRGRSNGSRAVPGTGRPAGPASTPGALKRQQAKAKIVKPKPVKGVRV